MNSQLGVINLPDDSGRACQYEVSIPVQISAKGISGVVGSFPNVVPIFKRDTVYNTQTYTLPCFKKSQLKLYAPVLGTDYIWEDGSINTEHIVTSSGKYWVSYNSAPCIRHIDTFNVIMPGSFVPLYGFIKQSCRGIKDGLAWIHPANGDTIQYIYTWFDTGGNILQKNTF